MLSRTFIVPEVINLEDSIKPETEPIPAPVPEPEENREDLGEDQLPTGIEGWIERVSSIRGESTTSKVEVELETLFSTMKDQGAQTEVERVIILLCKIAHQIMNSERIAEENEAILLQIFEIGLFMVQFKDRWITALLKASLLQEQGWAPLVEHTSVHQDFPPASDLVFLAQEYLIMGGSISNTRINLCAFALANALGVHHPTVSVLLRYFTPGQDRQIPAPLLFLVAYVLGYGDSVCAEVLSRWLEVSKEDIDGTVVYLPTLDMSRFFISEMGKITDISQFLAVAKASNSHELINQAKEAMVAAYEHQEVTTKRLADILSITYHEAEVSHTEAILDSLQEVNQEGAEAIAKLIIIDTKTTALSRHFFAKAVVIDRDYIEALIICREYLDYIPTEMLMGLCCGEYLSILCKEDKVFGEVIKVVEKREKSPHRLQMLIEKIFKTLPIEKTTLEKALLVTIYFPNLSIVIKRVIWNEIEKKGICFKMSAPTIAKDLEILNQFREIPQIESIILRGVKKHPETEEYLFHGFLDTFLIRYVKNKIRKTKKNLPVLAHFLAELEKKEEFKEASYWAILLKKKLQFGSLLKYINLPVGEIDTLVSHERDLGRLIQRKADPTLVLALLDRLDTISKYDKGIVFGSTSYLTITTEMPAASIYLSMIQKEFSGRQSLIKISGENSSSEVYLINGKGKITVIVKDTEITKDIDESFEEYTLGGWKLSLSVTTAPNEVLLTIGETSIRVKHPTKPVKEIVIGEGFKGILKRALVLEESAHRPEKLSAKPSELFYLDNLTNIEKTMQYHKKIGILLETTNPYQFSGTPVTMRLCNVFTNTPLYWRTSEKVVRALAHLAVKEPHLEERLLAVAVPSNRSL
ncbi:hypothetical protein NEDG_00655 [Nematocida displodere]|uniref:Uncharacterized protein n=1 Tax=Nematocida displodere TaxID=1805483 RepID=A0A177EEF1_9MICR|nr:hypothetical protein NEDG_00655 [Nematocida displodere]